MTKQKLIDTIMAHLSTVESIANKAQHAEYVTEQTKEDDFYFSGKAAGFREALYFIQQLEDCDDQSADS